MSDRRRADDTDKQLFELVRGRMLRWLEEGQPVIGPDGAPIMCEDGTMMMRPLNAAEMDKILKLLAQVDIGVVSVAGDEMHKLMELAKQSVFKLAGDGELPPLDVEGRDVATGT